MAKRIASFADLIHPVTEEEFFSTYHDRQYLHVPAQDPDKFADVMSWDILNNMLNMTAIWSPASLSLALDKQIIQPDQYCRSAIDRNNQQALQPDAEKVIAWLRRGASLVANDIDTLWAGTAAAADALEMRLGGRTQSNLYCSWDQRQAFDTHFDTHEVFALHITGEKVWNIYEGRLTNPIASDGFKNLDREFHDKNRGKVAAEVTLRPGDLLYIPRGVYHDALASSEACIHLAFGVTHVIGFDLINLVFEQALADPAFRGNMPLPEANTDERRTWINDLADRLQVIARSDEVAAALEAFRADFKYYRGGFDLPADALVPAVDERFGIALQNVAVKQHNGQFVLQSSKTAVQIPAGLGKPVSWVVDRQSFSRQELLDSFPELGLDGVNKLIRDLTAMKVISSN